MLCILKKHNYFYQIKVKKVANITFSCVFCKSKNDKIIVFSEVTLEKCRNVLKIRQKNQLKYKDVILPLEVPSSKGYHTRRYSNFTSLSGRYKKQLSISCTDSIIIRYCLKLDYLLQWKFYLNRNKNTGRYNIHNNVIKKKKKMLDVCTAYLRGS